jgi:hypothetical protein
MSQACDPFFILHSFFEVESLRTQLDICYADRTCFFPRNAKRAPKKEVNELRNTILKFCQKPFSAKFILSYDTRPGRIVTSASENRPQVGSRMTD